jgi:hypothetical protein
LGPPPAYADSFFNQFHGLQKIENLLDKDLEPSQKAAKAASDIELKRKIAKKVDSTNPIIPIDSERDFWKKYLVLT